MNSARVIFIDTISLFGRCVRIAPYRFVSITGRDFSWSVLSLCLSLSVLYRYLVTLSFSLCLRSVSSLIVFYGRSPLSLFFLLDFFHTNSPAVIVVDRHTRFNVAPVAPSARSPVKSAALSEFLFLPVVRPTSFRPILMKNRKSDRFQQRSSLSRRKKKKNSFFEWWSITRIERSITKE